MKQLGLLLIILGAALFMWRSVEKSQEEDVRIAQVVERHQVQKAQAAQVSLQESAVDASGPSDASDKPWRYEGRYGKKRIKDIRLGDRVIARNPEVSESERMDFVDPDSSWKQITLSMIKPDQTKVIVSLLRPQAWMARQDARIGGKIHLVLEELGLDGQAEVLAIDDAPEIKKGEGQVVTGTFHHQAGNVLDIAVKGLEDPIGTTSNHPFWSEDRQDFVQAGDLKVGEQLRQVDGSLTLVSSITNRGPPEQVYNIEVAGEHVYFVSDAGVLVHNSYLHPSSKTAMFRTARARAAQSSNTTTSAKVGKNQADWVHDQNGRLIEVSGVIKQDFGGATKGNIRSRVENALATLVGRRGKDADEGGHLIAHRFFKDQGIKNLFSQNSNLNKGAFKTLENDYARILKQYKGASLEFKHVLSNFDANGRAGSIVVQTVVRDKKGGVIDNIDHVFSNKPGQAYKRRF